LYLPIFPTMMFFFKFKSAFVFLKKCIVFFNYSTKLLYFILFLILYFIFIIMIFFILNCFNYSDFF